MKKLFKIGIPLLLIAFYFVSFNAFSVNAQESGEVEKLAPANPDRKIEWEGTPYVTDTTKPMTKARTMSIASDEEPLIIDVSHHQGKIDWAKVANVVDLVVIRTQYGSQLEDREHVSYEASAKKYGIPFGVYSYSLATGTADAKAEARDFYNRASKDAAFYVIDVEEFTSTTGESMRQITNAYIAELRKLTDKKIGLYIANHLYEKLNLDTTKADFVWIPRYGPNKPIYNHHLWQFTEQGKVAGISTYVDINRLADGVSLDFFTSQKKKESYYTTNPKQVATKTAIYEYSSTTFSDANRGKKISKNTILNVVSVTKNSSDAYRLKLSNGKYITANKKNVVKTISTIDNYFTQVPKKVILKNNQTAYKATNFTEANKVQRYNTNTIFTIGDIDYTASGTPRLKTVSGFYITANKSNVRLVQSDIMNYIYIKPKQIVTKSKVNEYTTVGFTKKTGKSYAKGKTVTVQGISWTAAGTPRLKIGTNRYISANLSYVKVK